MRRRSWKPIPCTHARTHPSSPLLVELNSTDTRKARRGRGVQVLLVVAQEYAGKNQRQSKWKWQCCAFAWRLIEPSASGSDDNLSVCLNICMYVCMYVCLSMSRDPLLQAVATALLMEKKEDAVHDGVCVCVCVCVYMHYYRRALLICCCCCSRGPPPHAP